MKKRKILNLITISILTLTLIITLTSCRRGFDPSQWRGVWVTNVDSKVLDSRESIEEAMAFLADKGFNVVMPVVWNDAWTLYPSKLMTAMFDREISPRFAGRDPLKELIDAAHANGLLVVAWFEYGFAASYKKNGGALLEKKPEWAAKDAEGNLLTKNGFEWMNGYMPEVQDFIISLVLEVVENYDVDGVQGDDRLPAQPIHGGYSDFTVDLYKSEHDGALPPGDHRDKEWQKWRGDKLNAFAKRLYDDVKAADPGVLVTWAPSVYPWCYDEYLQDWPAWIEGGYADAVIPQVYRYNREAYENTLTALDRIKKELKAYDTPILPGVLLNVGSYVMDNEFLDATIRMNREHGYDGEVFFFYEGLRKEGNRTANSIAPFYKDNK
ncbi:MAG: family 10 glycosylhydrolase [Candidatus Marinimicrobia bacterium]|nr:family 10 glycosylhydrolase [Candidatus Neomarinimicrobiota bacterium]